MRSNLVLPGRNDAPEAQLHQRAVRTVGALVRVESRSAIASLHSPIEHKPLAREGSTDETEIVGR